MVVKRFKSETVGSTFCTKVTIAGEVVILENIIEKEVLDVSNLKLKYSKVSNCFNSIDVFKWVKTDNNIKLFNINNEKMIITDVDLTDDINISKLTAVIIRKIKDAKEYLDLIIEQNQHEIEKFIVGFTKVLGSTVIYRFINNIKYMFKTDSVMRIAVLKYKTPKAYLEYLKSFYKYGVEKDINQRIIDYEALIIDLKLLVEDEHN